MASATFNPAVNSTAEVLLQANSASPASYDPMGHLVYAQLGLTAGNPTPAVQLTKQYDRRGRLMSETDGSLYSYSVPASGYDGVGNIISNIDSAVGAWTFNYDTLNRLTTAHASSGIYQGEYGCWVYDAFGNRTLEAFAMTTTTPCATGAPIGSPYTVTAPALKNQMSGFTYNAAGTTINDTRNNYAYDAEGRVCAIAVGLAGGGTSYTEYLYDAEGRRVAKVPGTSRSCAAPTNSPSNLYLLGLDGEQITELNGTGTILHTNAFQHGTLIATYDFVNGGFHLAFSDPLGTKRVQALLKSDGTASAELSCVSLPFGNNRTNTRVTDCEAIGNGGVDASEHHYTGKEHDTESGNDYFGARYLSISMGRWMSPDLVNVTEERMMNPSSTLNKYAYAANNPLKYTDPDGQDITIFFENGVPGHIMMMAYDPSLSSAATRSFGPAKTYSSGNRGSLPTIGGLPVPATTRFGFDKLTSADAIRKNFASITIQTSPEVTQQVVQALASHSGDKTYTTLGYACASSCARILRQIQQFSGVGREDALLPYQFFDEMYEKYGNGSAAAPWGDGTTNVFKPGSNYGAYRPSWNEFDVLNMLINSNQQRPTRSCTIYVTPNGTSGDC